MYSGQSPVISIDAASAVPARRQILDQFRNLLVEGALSPGDELPSVRRLAIDLGVHFNTVAEAYRLLAEEHWIEVSQGRAARVLARGKQPGPDAENVLQFRGRLRSLIAEMRSQGHTPARIARELTMAAEGLKA